MKNGGQPLIQIRKSLKVRWYRSPIENSTLKELCLRSNLKGFIQTLSHIGLFIITGTLTSLCFIWEEWVWFCLTLWLHGTIGVFFASATHELGHGTVFKTQKLNIFFLMHQQCKVFFLGSVLASFFQYHIKFLVLVFLVC